MHLKKPSHIRHTVWKQHMSWMKVMDEEREARATAQPKRSRKLREKSGRPPESETPDP